MWRNTHRAKPIGDWRVCWSVMKKPFVFAIVIATLVAVSGGLAWATEPSHAQSAQPGRHTRRLRWERAKEKLGLTDEQLGRIKVELRAEKPALKKSLEKLHAARSALREVVRKPSATEAEIRDAAMEVGTATADLAMHRARIMARIRPILTPEQSEKLEYLRGQFD